MVVMVIYCCLGGRCGCVALDLLCLLLRCSGFVAVFWYCIVNSVVVLYTLDDYVLVYIWYWFAGLRLV